LPVDDLIRELLATGEMNEDTAADLNRMLAEQQAGTLHADDAAYIRALHARITGNAASATEPEAEVSGPERLDGLTIADWRDRAMKAEAALAEVREQLAAEGS
jgi:hypothetical protein